MYANIASTSSIVIPATGVQRPLWDAKYQTRDKEVTLESITQVLSRDNPNTLVTILVAACRVNPSSTIRGIPLERYGTYINEHYSTKWKTSNESLHQSTYAQYDNTMFNQRIHNNRV